MATELSDGLPLPPILEARRVACSSDSMAKEPDWRSSSQGVFRIVVGAFITTNTDSPIKLLHFQHLACFATECVISGPH